MQEASLLDELIDELELHGRRQRVDEFLRQAAEPEPAGAGEARSRR